MKPELSIVILNHNTGKLLRQLLASLQKVQNEVNFEVIVVDNASTDDSKLKLKSKNILLIENQSNLGFAKGNNSARGKVSGKYVLFLNSDTKIPKGALAAAVEKISSDKKIGILTCKMKMKSGKLDRDARRSFPTPWVTLTHFSGLDRIFPKVKLFSKYWYGWISPDVEHDIDVAQGAFLLTRKDLLDEVGWFDEDYFIDGEDIDLSWKVKKERYRIIYYPVVWIWHFKKGTKKSRHKKLFLVTQGVEAMRIFYKKRLAGNYPLFINMLVYFGIDLIKFVRTVKFRLS